MSDDVLTLTKPIVLLGFMGAGKTTVARALADRLGWRLVDLDHVIEYDSGISIQKMFAQEGEPAFRRREADALRNSLAEAESGIVVATGGGAVEAQENRDRMRADAVTVFLDVDFDTLWARVSKSRRPLAKEPEMFRARYDARLPYYREADIIISISNETPDDIAREIVRRLSEDE